MKLIKAHVTNFRSIEDSNEFEIGNLTCLVGKNEAGKTGLLRALDGLASFDKFEYDKVQDYPRRYLSKFEERHADGEARVIFTVWKLDEEDKRALKEAFGAKAVTTDEITIEYGFEYDARRWDIRVNHRACLEHYIGKQNLDAGESAILQGCKTAAEAVAQLEAQAQRTEQLNAVLKALKALRETDFSLAVIDVLEKRRPKFFYTSHFDRMAGAISLTKLAADRAANKKIDKADSIFLDFLQYAGTTVEELQNATKYEQLKAKLEAASNEITEEIFQFWSQNDALEVKIEIGEGRKDDEPPFHSGTVIKIRIENRNHRASIPLSERSAGFVWFFSFLAQFKQLKKTAGNAILLLDEPGLTLHGKAQSDLLRYIEQRLLPQHQVIYTTHSPFMIPSDRLETVRIVEDVVIREDRKTTVLGTKVSSDVLRVDKDTLFPLQGALGYEISQSLFVGKNSLLVEGPGDILFIEVASRALRKRGRLGLDTRWTMCPAGGIDKISPFVSLFGGNRLNVAVLCDLAAGQKGKIEKLRRDVLNAGQLFTAADFTGKQESDVEDFFHPAQYAGLLNQAFGLTGALVLNEKKLLAADPNTERLVKKAEAAFKVMPAGSPEFDHFTPAEWLLRNPGFFDADTTETTHTLGVFEKAVAAVNKILPAK